MKLEVGKKYKVAHPDYDYVEIESAAVTPGYFFGHAYSKSVMYYIGIWHEDGKHIHNGSNMHILEEYGAIPNVRKNIEGKYIVNGLHIKTITCQCGADKHGFTGHMNFCPKA